MFDIILVDSKIPTSQNPWKLYSSHVLCPNVAIFLKNVFIFKDRTLKKIIFKGRGFRWGSDEKMMRMWFGLEINVVGLPPLVGQNWQISVINHFVYHHNT